MIKLSKRLKKIKFYTVNLPLILITIPIGFIFEFIITFPYIIFCTLDSTGKGLKSQPSTED